MTIFLYFSKAFHTLDHGISLPKFNHIGFKDILLYDSYLLGRKQNVIRTSHNSISIMINDPMKKYLCGFLR